MSPAPMLAWCGPELSLLYNDAAIPLLGAAHPAALGQTVPEKNERWSTIQTALSSIVAERQPRKVAGLSLLPVFDADGLVAVLGTPVAASFMGEKRESRDEYLARVGDELRAPLSNVSTIVHALMLRGPTRELELVERSVRQLSQLVEDLLETPREADATTLVEVAGLAECGVDLPPDARAAPISAARRRLLLVEDNDDAARALKIALELLGYEVALAHDAPLALNLARTFRPDVALLDLTLPVMDGWELARRLRQASATLPIVAVTARDQDSDKQKSREAGIAEHLVKPIDLPRLQRIVDELSASSVSGP